MLINDIIEKLTSLCTLDSDAIKSYDSVLKKINDKEIFDSILNFRNDHLRHVEDLSHLIKALGGTPPSSTPDIRGLFLTAMSSLQSLTGTEGALRGLKSGEIVTNKAYEDVVDQDFPPDILSVLTRNYKDEKIHLDYVNKALESKAWEHRKAA